MMVLERLPKLFDNIYGKAYYTYNAVIDMDKFLVRHRIL